MAGENKEWYVLRAISGKEAKVKEVLDAQMRNTNLGQYVFQVLIPTEKVLTTRNGKKVVKERTLYSGYVFIQANLTGEIEYELRNTTNVIDFLRGRAKGSKPEVLREADVMRMMGRAEDLQVPVDEVLSDYKIGEAVKVQSGPFSGFSGVICDVNAEKSKLKVEVKIFGRGTEIELDYSQVEKE